MLKLIMCAGAASMCQLLYFVGYPLPVSDN